MNKIEKEYSSGVITNLTFSTGVMPQVLDTILLTRLPMPPSSNHQYRLFRRGGKTYHAASDELKAFQRQMEKYPYQDRTILEKRHKAQIWISQGLPLEIRTLFFFHHKRLFTLENKVKKMDVSNRLKALHDQVALLLGIDDSFFFRVYAEKAEIKDHVNEMVCVEILPIKSPPIIQNFL